jgi:hypothetical protein
MWSRRSIPAVIVACMLLLGTALPSIADGSWLDGDLSSWNAAGRAIPAAPGEAFVPGGMESCQPSVRPAETPEDVQVADRGCLLTAPYQLGWGIAVIEGFLRFDANCRPVSYQQFVFVDGVFAGTLAPEAMLPRTDGALFDLWIGPDEVGALYDRYAPGAGLCCPSAQTRVPFVVERTATGPVVTPTHADDLPAPSPGR